MVMTMVAMQDRECLELFPDGGDPVDLIRP